MALVNDHFLKLPNNYLFADIAKKVNAFKVMHPKADVISLGIGDVTQPLCPAVVEAMHKAADEMGTFEGFRGYGPEQGYDFLREAILKNDFLPRGIHKRRCKVRHRKHSGTYPLGQFHCRHRPHLSCLHRFQCDDWTCRTERR